MDGFSLTYIYHDCFLFESSEAVILFDYWKDPLSKGGNKDFPPLLNELDRGKPVYILISHHHKDHFSRRVFLWQEKLPGIKYIVSQDVYRAAKFMLEPLGTYSGFRPSPGSVNVLTPGETFSDGIISVKAFPSTDMGNSYAVTCNGMRIFHAGDLNAWLWVDEATPEEIREARESFTSIVDGIASEFPEFDLVMFPVDSRLRTDYFWGAGHFVNKIRSRIFVPMHFELVEDENEKEQRRIDAAAFNLFARKDFGTYLQLCGTRSRLLKAPGSAES